MPKILVKGNVYTQADEVGVTVNGQPAQVQGGLWFANNMELRAGTNTITATATQPDGRTMTHTVTINLDTATPTDWIDLDVNPESGTAPLTTSLKVTRHITSFTPTDETISSAGPGTMTYADTEVDEYALTFATPGLYAIFYTATDGPGQEVTGEIMVNVEDKAAITVLLKARWDGMAAKLGTRPQ